MNLRATFKTIWTRLSNAGSMLLRDRAAGVDINRAYVGREWAQRSPNQRADLDAPKINSNVYIAVRAITDAIMSLPVSIVEIESDNGKDRIVPASDNPASEVLRKPNPEHSWSDFISYLTKAYLTDGNAICTMERFTGPNLRLELWPRDPRTVEIGTISRGYRFGSYTANQITYKREDVLHIRDLDTSNPYWGVGRVNTIREEIWLDYFITTFNRKFFENGATLNLMFTPDENLTEDQHLQLLDAFTAEVGGADNAFKIFINRYAGKFTYPEQTHKDIAFLELLKHNREKTFGVFGLPPFRGGVMEYANYANALQQDLDFWLNTIQPIIKAISDAFNKQVLWPNFGENLQIHFDMNAIPAIQGDKGAHVKRLIDLKTANIVSAEFVRKELGIPEEAAPSDGETPVAGPDVQQAETEIVQALYQQFKVQRELVLRKLRTITFNGAIMSVLCDPATQIYRMLPLVDSNKHLVGAVMPLMQTNLVLPMNRDNIVPTQNDLDVLYRSLTIQLETIHDQTYNLLCSVMVEADAHNWTLAQLEKAVRGIFTFGRATTVGRSLVHDAAEKVKQLHYTIQGDTI